MAATDRVDADGGPTSSLEELEIPSITAPDIQNPLQEAVELLQVHDAFKDGPDLGRQGGFELALAQPADVLANLLGPALLFDGLIGRRFFHGTHSLEKLIDKVRLVAQTQQHLGRRPQFRGSA